MSSTSGQSSTPTLLPWEPLRLLKGLTAKEAGLSKGFLRSKPEQWFPGIAASWSPLTQSFAVECKVVEVLPLLKMPRGLPFAFGAKVDDAAIGFFIDDITTRQIISCCIQDASPQAGSVFIEYLVRRFFSTLASAWTGPSFKEAIFDSELNVREVSFAGVVKVGFRLQGQACSVWIGLSDELVKQFDSLWRKQVASSGAKHQSPISEIRLEIAQLGVPPASLSDYVKPKTVIDLEVPVSDTLIARGGGKSLFAAQLLDIEGMLGIEVLPGPTPNPIIPQGMTRIGIELGVIRLMPEAFTESVQPGCILETNIDLSDKVSLVINDESVAQGKLCIHEGRFALIVG